MIVGVAIWVALHESGIDPVIAGLAVGLVTSAYPPARSDLERVTEVAREFREQPTPELARAAQLSVASAISANERLQYRLHPWTSFVIVPLFALANAGIHIDGAAARATPPPRPITLGILFGYVVGKPVGIVAGTWLAARLGRMRLVLSWPTIVGGGVIAGIGFTVALLISNLAFAGQELEEAKIGIFSAAIVSSLLAFAVFRVIERLPTRVRARQIARTADELVDLADDVDPDRDHIRGLARRAGHAARVRRLRVPVLRARRGHHARAARPVRRRPAYVWRSLPLNDVHPNAQIAAEAAEAAGAQGAFWEMHDRLLDHQDELSAADLRRHAEDLGLDVERFWDELSHRKYAQRVEEDVMSADASGVAGTPTFFINGRRHQGAYDAQILTDEVQRARNRVRLSEHAAVSSPELLYG